MEKNINSTQGVSPLTQASSNPRVQNKITQALARGPGLPQSRGASGMLSSWGEEAGRGSRDLSKMPVKYPSDERELQGGVGFYHDQWKQVTLRAKNPKFTPVRLPSSVPRPGAGPPRGTAAPPTLPWCSACCQMDSLPASRDCCRKTERKPSSSHLLFHLCKLVV